jgi:deoxycytidylate deaminase
MFFDLLKDFCVVTKEILRLKNAARARKLHMEVDAIFRVASKTGLSRVTLYSARITKSGDPGSSYPCSSCQQIIKAVGVKRVVYFDGEKLAEWIP